MKIKLLIAFLFLTWTGLAQKRQTYQYLDEVLVKYQLEIHPVQSPKGWVLLLPGFGETPESVLKESDIPVVAAQNGLLVIIPFLNASPPSFYIDELSQKALESIVNKTSERLKLHKTPFFLGGFSLGGSGAIRLAKRLVEHNNPIPKAIFGIDPPLDFARFYQSIERTIWLSQSAIASEEAKYLVERLKTEFEGTPENNPQKYQDLSCFSYQSKDLNQLDWLKKIPLRLYTEIAIEWQMQERNRDLYDINAIDCVAMINTLKILGATQSELIVTKDQGWRRQQKMRNPHSWSICEPRALVKWLLKWTL